MKCRALWHPPFCLSDERNPDARVCGLGSNVGGVDLRDRSPFPKRGGVGRAVPTSTAFGVVLGFFPPPPPYLAGAIL